MRKTNLRVLILLASMLLAGVTAYGQGTAFTYQGKLTDNGNLATGNYDFQFKLFDALTAGTQLGTTQTLSNVPVSNGIFSVQLDFGACPTCFNGAARFLEISVKPTSGSTFTTLGPRQLITSTPYALKSQNATSADGLSVACVNCVTSSQIASVSGSAVTGAIPVASVPAGSANYIQNTSSPQASSDFNISGNGTAAGTLSAAFVDASFHYRIAGLRAFTVNGPFNSGTNIFTASNTFAGDGAGLNTMPSSTLSSFNGKFNAFFGAGAGQANTTGLENSFFGSQTGQATTTGNFNSFFGYAAGQHNTSGGQNTFFGRIAGFNNTIGANNTFIGFSADFDVANPTGDQNTLLGASSKVTSGSSNATAIGYRAQVAQSNSLVLGGITGVNSGTDTKVGIGTTAPGAVLDVQRDQDTIPETARFTTYGLDNEILSRASGGTRAVPTATTSGRILLQLGATGHIGTDFATTPRATIQMTAAEAWTASAQGTRMRFTTTTSGTTATSTRMTIADDGNVGIGTTAPNTRLDVVDSSAAQIHFGNSSSDNGGYLVSTAASQAILSGGAKFNGSAWIAKSTAASLISNEGGDIKFFINSGLTSGSSYSPTERMRIDQNGNVGIGTTDPGAKLHVAGTLRVDTLVAGNSISVCRSIFNNNLSDCSSSIRYKTNVATLHSGFSLIQRLRPVTFTWKADQARDLGLIAEEVAKVEPLLTFRNDKGEIEGVKYDRVTVVLVNAVKEQQAQLEQQQRIIERQQQRFNQQQQQLEALKKLVCASHRKAKACK